MNAAASPRLQIVVLAAGMSRRLGRPKALARVRGTSLLLRTVAQLAPLAGPRILVVAPPRSTRYQAELRGQPVALIANPRRGRGLSSSVRLALAHARYCAAMLLVPVDLVELRRDEMAKLIRRWKSSPRRVVARRIEGRGRTPMIVPKWLFSAAAEITGDRGLREWVDRLPAGQAVLIEVPSAARDVDTREDLERARRGPPRRHQTADGTSR
jgi:CTP:molybdopterin cytidylyltransferase MocA